MQKPLQGLTFCPTALPEDASRSVSRKIAKLGGGFSKDLTKLVNVLIVGSVATNKYRFAVQNRADMAFVGVDAIDTIYDLWLTGDDISMESHSNFSGIKNPRERMLSVLRTRYRLGALKDFVVFIGRVGDDQEGKLSPDSLERLCVGQGVHSCNTRHFVKESHWNRPTVFVTDCSRGARVDAARSQGLPIVHPKWILDCHSRSALLDFAFYLLENTEHLSFEAVGTGSCMCWDEISHQSSSAATNAHEDEPRLSQRVVLDKFASDGHRLWNSVMHKTKKISPVETLPLSNNETTKELAGLFHDKHCYLFDFPQKHEAVLHNIIVRNSGSCYDYKDGIQIHEPSYLVVPSSTPRHAFASVGEMFTHVVTEFFFERCLHYKKLLSPDPWCSPFFSDFEVTPSGHLRQNLTTSEPLKVAITGFQGVELLHITKILEYLEPSGLKLSQKLNKETNILVINLGALNSIPGNHPLWNNQYASMFEEGKKLEQNQIHRNSMKRKIEFIKQRHSIPVVTAAFILELFSRAFRAKAQQKVSSRIHLNDVNWCISCPKGDKDQFYCDIRTKETELTGTGLETSPSTNDCVSRSIKQNRQEALSIFHSVSSLASKRPLHEESVAVHHNAEKAPSPPPKIPRLVPTEALRPVQRSSSWGNVLSDQARKVDGLHESDAEPSADQKELKHTQVTYGSPKQMNDVQAPPTRRLTRQRMREIDT
ncbi:LAQU0S01e13234g1_1 [Lachancea quebecensis]|uniref:LAQU0S01e13234g1_1 n=1 Tax=Lachancea quebecensis TaxID=1654605 RepID=A0A0P1KXH9_9SACH|nr:LAQU0S01e13234g1_1 [Lachancea quebecensis]